MARSANDWKACSPQKGLGGSNPPHSAINVRHSKDFAFGGTTGKRWRNTALGGKKTEKQPKRMRKVRVSLYLRPKLNKDGTAPLLIAVNHASSSLYIPIAGVALKPSQWDKARKKVINHPKADTINSVALTLLGKANEAVMQLGSVRGLPTTKVRDMIADYILPPAEQDTGVLAVMQAYMNQCRKPNTADKFKQTLAHLRRWQGAKGSRALQFADITPDWLQAFDSYLITYCPSLNSRGIHLRNVRTIFNHALSHQLTTAPYPFRQYKIKTAPSNPTPLTLEQMRTLWHYHPQKPMQAYSLDIFRLIFALIGINMADLATLTSVSQGRINYNRAKTGRLYSIKVEPPAKAIIKAHKGDKYLLNILTRYKSVHTATAQINRHLKEIACDLALPPITTYTARYSWATIASAIDTPIEVISQALGHSYGMEVTLGYILPDRRKVDSANKRILDLLLA